MNISSNFDSGNIELLSISDKSEIKLKIRKDTNADFFQWFYFRLSGAEGKQCSIYIENAGESSYPEGWDDYNVVASYDKKEWFRIPTSYQNGVLSFEYMPLFDSIFFAYFAPFTYEQHLELVHTAQMSEICNLEIIGQTVEGRDIELLKIGTFSTNKKNIWIIARQHPGEIMAEWFIKGLITRILDENDPVSRTLLEKANFFIVPNANIDGSIAGNLRANAAGANLNREWLNADIKTAPEVYYILQKMKQTGADMFLDIHGDEGLPYNFVSGTEGVPSYNKRMQKLENTFKKAWKSSSPDFQDEHHYPLNEAGKANLSIGTKQVGEFFKCLSYTVEMPFKDNQALPDYFYGWSNTRAEIFGKSVLNPVLKVVEKLR